MPLRDTQLNLLPSSLVTADGVQFGLAQTASGQRLAVSAPAGAAILADFEGEVSEAAAQPLLLGPTSPRNAGALRVHLPWLQPGLLGLRTSAGMGDRLGLATPGHVRAVRAVGGGIAPIFAQQSIREMLRTGRTPQQVMDDATWGIFREGWRAGIGADADHLKTTADIDACRTAGFTFFTIDPSEHVDASADGVDEATLRVRYQALPWSELMTHAAGLCALYFNRPIELEDRAMTFDEETLLRAAVKYGRAVAHIVAMYRHLDQKTDGDGSSSATPHVRPPQVGAGVGQRSFELEISVDETAAPTSHAEHIFIACELQRLGVRWVSLAPRFAGRFEKGVDYLGDLAEFEADFAGHAAIARALGPYKLSLHSGSDKFSIYPAVARQARGLVHLKTAGTSYLEGLRTLAALDPTLFRAIFAFARERYETDRISYRVSADLRAVPDPVGLADTALPGLLDQFDARQILHVTFGSVLVANQGFKACLLAGLAAHEAEHYAALERHFGRHLQPFAR